MSKPQSDRPVILALVAVWLAMLALAQAHGDFPLDDDWAYGFTVEHLLRTGHFRLSGWSSMNLISQAFWGALFCLPGGFSFEALRISSQLLGLGGVLATYGLARECGAERAMAVLAALLLAANPVYFQLASTFMTDVPFTALTAGSVWLLARGMRTGSRSEFLLGALLALAAMLDRQNGIAIPAAVV